ncbi:MAG TPA: PEP/pyruvate-binding domain-containing protein [Elusimicrobiales bacterium]|nr:PEP/pyruvate-binding domain-containing protein [Elusimicrobiales bacterium]
MKTIFFSALFILCSATALSSAPHLRQINSPADFAAVTAPSFFATSPGLPMTMVLLDRKNADIYYINPASYPLHMDFINTQLLSLDKGLLFIDNTESDTRRFLSGFLIGRKDCLTLELWEDDYLNPALVTELYEAVTRTFYKTCIKFNPLSEGHLLMRDATTIPFYATRLQKPAPGYQMLSEGVSYGKMHLADKLPGPIKTGAIYVLKEVPIYLSAGVAGFVTSEVASAFSHACILARTLGTPAFFLPAAEEYFKGLEGRDVRFEVLRDTFSVTLASPEDTEKYMKARLGRIKRPLFADLEWTGLTDLENQSASDIPRFGAKSSNLGQVTTFAIPGIKVPHGFTIPFYYYAQFIRENDLGDLIAELLADKAIYQDPVLRAQRLAGLRKRIETGKMNPGLAGAIRAKLASDFKGKGVFARSTTNSEDLAGFSGAGLYTTVPNVVAPEEVLEAVKKVWASIWNDRAFDAREIAGIDHKTAMPAVLIQEGKDADAAGVMFTSSDLPGARQGCVGIGAKKGLGIRVVEGHAEPERIFYCADGRVYTDNPSMDDRMLRFAEKGGVTESTVPDAKPVLAKELAERLGKAGLEIEKKFNGIPQDIEWLVIGETIYIVQSRPYSFARDTAAPAQR